VLIEQPREKGSLNEGHGFSRAAEGLA